VTTGVDPAQRWILRAGAVALPLGFFWGALDGFVLPKLLIARLLVLALGTLLVVRWIGQGRVDWRPTRIDWPLLAFLASALLSTVFAVNRNLALFGSYMRYEGFFTIVTYAALFWLTVQTLAGIDDARALLRSLLVAAYLVSVLAVVQSVVESGGRQAGGSETAFTVDGIVRAIGTFGNANALALFLAMLLPLALQEVLDAHSAVGRLLAANVVILMALALALTFGRAAWIGAALGIVLVLIRRSRPGLGIAAVVIALGLVAIALVVIVGTPPWTPPLIRAAVTRLASIGNLSTGTIVTRFHVWRDAVALIVSRPLIGYGPDSFGLVFPRFETGNWTPGAIVDKAHADLLQVAATQGLVGVAASVWIVVTFIRSFLAVLPGSRGLLGGWLAYEVALQANFSYLPAAAPFWIFCGAAVMTLPQVSERRSVFQIAGRLRPTLPALAACVALLAAFFAIRVVAFPYVADAGFRAGLAAQAAGRLDAAKAAVFGARRLAPTESLYAGEAGDLELDLHGDVPGPRVDWAAARQQYLEAAALGSFNSAVFRRLALADRALGRTDDAIAAAKEAVELDRFSSANQELLRALSPN
jgi:O-antigen ligase